MLVAKKEYLSKGVTNNDAISIFLDKIIAKNYMFNIDGTLKANEVGNSVFIMLDNKNVCSVTLDDIKSNKSSLLEDVCKKILLFTNGVGFTQYIVGLLSKLIDGSYGKVIKIDNRSNLIQFISNRDNKIHNISLTLEGFNARVVFDRMNTGILIPDLSGKFFDRSLCYNQPNSSYDTNSINKVIEDYLL